MRAGGVAGAASNGVSNAIEIQATYNNTKRSVDAKVSDVYKTPMSFSSDGSD